MSGAKSKGKFIIACIMTFLFPILFPYFYIKYKDKFSKFTLIVYPIGYLATLFVCLIISTAITPNSKSEIGYVDQASVYDISQGTAKSKSEIYRERFYQELKSADAAETLTNPTKTDNASQQGGNNNSGSSSSSTNTTKLQSTNNQQSQTNNAQPQSAGAMAGIVIAEADASPYKRDNYGSGWNVGSGCNIRSRLLTKQSTVQVQTSDGCLVTYGSWVDPYSGRVLTGNPYQGDGEQNDLDIDHIIPLRYVNSHGGYAWSYSQKVAYGKSLAAMNNGVYIAVSSTENRKKSDKGPADYYPSNPNFYCEYSIRWRNIARAYSISLSRRDYNKIQKVLADCGVN